MKYVLYNPLSDNSSGADNAKELLEKYPSHKYVFLDITSLSDEQIFELLEKDDGDVILSGGDGTLNRFANTVSGRVTDKPIYYYPTGTGNDFKVDVLGKTGKELILLNDYISTLPEINVKGKSHKFINGVGYGIDGYSCEVVDKKKKQDGKHGNYVLAAFKGLMYSYDAGKAVVTVDGVTREFEDVWMVSAMNGKYFGGGVMIAPMQNRMNPEHTVSVIVVTAKKRVNILMAFPSIFKGKHLKYTDMVKVFTGKQISVKLDRPSPLQIDGDVFSGVTEYTVTAYGAENTELKEKTEETV
jgi:diacylglycerol kinase family enzyme